MSDYDEEHPEPILNIGTYTGDRNRLGERCGKGKNVFPNKDIYVGEYEGGVRNGRGTYRWAYLGVKYVGEYLNGQRNGHGIMHYTNGTVYSGSWAEGRRSGHGEITYPNGDSYIGEWKDDLPCGFGEYRYKSCGVVMRGTFAAGRIINGEMVMLDGSVYEGEFRMNQPFGKGAWIVNGFKQNGEYIELNPPEKEEEEEEEGADQEPDIDPEPSADEEQPEEEQNPDDEDEEEEKEQGEQSVIKFVRKRKTIPIIMPPKTEKLRTMKLKWVPTGLPEPVDV